MIALTVVIRELHDRTDCGDPRITGHYSYVVLNVHQYVAFIHAEQSL